MVVQDIAFGAAGHWLESLASRIGHSVTNLFTTAAMFLHSCVARALMRRDGPRHTRQSKTASTTKI